ncbi:MAG: TolC family protein, partial [Vicinamibacteria bacterium]
MIRRFVVLLALSSSVGCKLGPDYARPPVVTPEKWRELAAADASVANVPWWELFQDEELRKLITTALEENRDLKIAIERIEEARALYGISRSELYPQVDASAVGGSLKFSEGSLTHTPDADENQERDTTKGLASIGVGFSWELDFFGRIRRANEAELARLLATQEARRAVALTLVSDVARAYVDLRGLDRRLEIA